MALWRACKFLSVTGRSLAKSYCLNPAHRRQGMPKLCLDHFAPLKHGACTMGTPPIWHRRAHSPMRPVLQYMGGGGGVKVRARRGAWRTLGAVQAHGVADSTAAPTCRSARGTARPQAAGGAMEAWGGQRGTSVLLPRILASPRPDSRWACEILPVPCQCHRILS